ncbi:MAG: T9SS C-terminal target domain-containing protein, partial [Bacteroidetes bacterium]
FSDAGSFGFSPAFGDLDNDGDADLVVGEKDGFLFFVENTAGAGAPMSFGAPQFGWMGIDAGQFATPQIADLNRDGLMDLVIGRHGRQVQYYQNQGTPGAPFFDPDKNNPPNIAELGGMMAESIIPQVFTSTAFGAPTVLDFGDSFKILLGSDNGKIKLYDHIENNLDGTFDLLTETFGNTKEGFRIRQAAADLNDDGFLDLVVGNFRGGLSFFSTNLSTDGMISATQQIDNQLFVKIFPNPADQFIRLEKTGADAAPMRVRVFNSMGVSLAERVFYSDEMTFETSRWPAGFYYIQMEQNGFIFTQKIALHH